MQDAEPALEWYNRLTAFPGVSLSEWLAMPADLVAQLDYISAEKARHEADELKRLKR